MRVVALALLLLGCGEQLGFAADGSYPVTVLPPLPPPPPPTSQTFSLEVENRYAASNFNVAVSVIHPLDGGTSRPGDAGVYGWGQAFMAYDLVRIQAYEKKSAGPFEISLGSDVEITFNVQSLGQWHNFPNIRVNPTTRRRFRAIYDYDIASSRFTLQHTE